MASRRRVLEISGLSVGLIGAGFYWLQQDKAKNLRGGHEATPPDPESKKMFGHGLKNRSYLPNETVPTSGVKELWSFEADDWVLSDPVLDGEKLYFGSFDGRLYCLNAETGELEWKYDSGGRIESTPLVTNKLVYFTSHSGEVVCLNKDTQEPVWTKELDGWIRTSPKINDEKVYVANYKYLSGPTETNELNEGRIRALDWLTGETKWTTDLQDYFYSSPSFDDGLMYMGGLYEGTVYALDTGSGEVVWENQTPRQVPGSISLADNMAYVSTYPDFLCLNKETGDELWSVDTDAPGNTTPCVSSDSVFFGDTDGTHYAVDRNTGEIIWKKEMDTYLYSGGFVCTDDVLLSHTLDGTIRALNTSDGRELWSYCLPNLTRPIPAVDNEDIYLCSHGQEPEPTGSVHCLSPEGETPDEPDNCKYDEDYLESYHREREWHK